MRFWRLDFGFSGAGGGRPVLAAARKASSTESGYSDSLSRLALFLEAGFSFEFIREAGGNCAIGKSQTP